MFNHIGDTKKAVKKIKQLIYLLQHSQVNRVVFIHINKTGGSSVEKALRIPFEHKTALEKIQEIGQKEWEKKFSFTIVRNPWDKVVSHYHYRVERNYTELKYTPIEFREWVRLAYGKQNAFYYDIPKMFMPQIDWITDEKDKILVDEIIRFENLDEEFNNLMQKIGIKGVMLPHVKKSSHKHYREYYDEETFEIVKSWFERDIRIFDYQF